MTRLIDLTSARPGTEEYVLERVLDSIPEGEPPEVYVLANQQATLENVARTRGVVLTAVDDATPETNRVSSIAEGVNRLAAESESVRVYSFSPHVKHFVLALQRAYPGKLQFEPLARYARADGDARAAGAWEATFMSEEEAGLALARAISNSRSTAVYKTGLRPLLEMDDARFSKAAGGFPSAPGFISALVGVAESRGLVQTHGAEPRIMVVLTEAGRQLVASASAGADSGEPDTVEGEEKSRSSQFADSWRGAGLGSFMTVRRAVYDEIDRALAGGPKQLRALVNDSVAAARASRTDIDDKFPWSRVRLFIEEVMRRRPVALSNDGPVALTWTNGATEIEKMDEDWQLRLDGELVLHLVDDGFDLTIADMADLAGALYNARGEEEMDRTYAVIERLVVDKRLMNVEPQEPLKRVPQTLRVAAEADSAGAS